jgi:hypothetical protein
MSNLYEFKIKDNKRCIYLNDQLFNIYCVDWGRNSLFCDITAYSILLHEYGNVTATKFHSKLAEYLAKQPNQENFSITSNHLWFLIEKFECQQKN